MVQMARRPFSSVQVEVNPISVNDEDVGIIPVSEMLSHRRKVSANCTYYIDLFDECKFRLNVIILYAYFYQEYPNPIAMEPCGNNRAAVLSLIVRLPTGGRAHAPLGQTGKQRNRLHHEVFCPLEIT